MVIRIHGGLEQRRMQQVSSRLFGLFRELATVPLLGKSTVTVDRYVRRYLLRHGMMSATVSYRGYPAHCSVSVNDVAVHGVPDERVIGRGDLFTVDVAARADGFVTDTAWTYLTPGASHRDVELVHRGWRAFRALLKTIQPGISIAEIGANARICAEAEALGIVPEFVGHGIGRELHEPPVIPFVSETRRRWTERNESESPDVSPGDVRLAPGMIVNIEPVFSAGATAVTQLQDGWGFILDDRSRSVHFELSVLIGDNGGSILQFDGLPVRQLPEEPPFTIRFL